jgi:hypothetical protein
MEEELVGLRGRGTWELCAASDKIKPLPVKWVFKVKRDDQGKVARFKARLVVMGCRQVEGVDYGEVFAPTGTPATFRTLLATAAAGGWAVEGVDVTQAFLYGNLDEEVYIQQPAGFKDGSPRVCLLKKALYGLKQAPKVWYAELKGVLINTFGFVVSMADPCLFVHKSLQVYIHVYVDDMVVAGASAEHVNNIIQSISNTFKITRDGGLKHHLGMEVIRAGGSITLTQKRYTLDVLAKFDVSKLPRSLPLPPHPRLLQDMGAWSGGDAHIPLHRYGELIGCLLYLSVWTRPDISFAVGVLCRFMKDPTQHHMAAAINLLRYLLGTQGVGLVFGGAPILRAWSDADYAGSESDGKSTSGWLCTIGGAPVVWSSKKQSTVAASTCEAEFISACGVVKEVLWLRLLCMELGNDIQLPTTLHCDNQSAIQLLHNHQFSHKIKHINVAYHFVRERLALGHIVLQYVPTKENVADVLTKPLPNPAFTVFKNILIS